MKAKEILESAPRVDSILSLDFPPTLFFMIGRLYEVGGSHARAQNFSGQKLILLFT